MTTRTENVLVLYGSQTGNSEQAAKDLCAQVETNLTPEIIQKLVHNTKDYITVKPTHMQLDDFLELEKAAWTRLVVIVVSSYGVGQAPLGGYRFRELCDAWAENKDTNILDGVYFAMCGLGDSKYTTFFQNPTKINDTLIQVGAQRVGPLGKADASGTGKDAQLEVIERWMDGIWPHLAEVVAKDPLPAERLEQMQNQTIALCRKINPDLFPGESSKSSQQIIPSISILVAILSVVAYVYINSK